MYCYHTHTGDFCQAFLVSESCFDANLHSANLQRANLRQAYMEQASLRNARLQAANLNQADVEEAGFEGALYNSDTIWPDGFDSTKDRAVNVGKN